MLILAFDTATEIATSALVEDKAVLAECRGVARRLLEDLDRMLDDCGRRQEQISAIVVGTGPGSFTGTRIGLATARGLALMLGVPAAGVSTLDALAAGAAAAIPVIDARRGEVFVPGPLAMRPDDLRIEPGTVCVGDGAVRYRSALESRGARVPPDDSDLHVPAARWHVALAGPLGPADEILPVYVRAPDADRVLT